ncbi:MAG: hypothetical protein PHC86_01130 [Eubacteriales bacterium]|nr:hypothetical protein [Eubacteriales bacterium]
MKNFWGYIKNEQYAIGCTGQTVYVLDSSGHELAKFKDIKYGYNPMFCPNHNVFVVKSTAGEIAVYSLDKMNLIMKFRYSKVDGAQDDGFCFSKDGSFFYNIERHIDSCKTCLSIYRTSDFRRIKQLFLDNSSIVLDSIEYDSDKDNIYILGFMRGDSGGFDYGFVALLIDERLYNVTRLANDVYEYISGFKHLELFGFTSKAKKWSKMGGYSSESNDYESKMIRLSDFIQSR